MPNFQDTFLRLARLLLPAGRAFRAPEGGAHEKLQRALAASESRAFGAALSILDSAIADGPGFTADDATDWERRLGLASNAGTALPTRMAAINQRLNFPGTVQPRQHVSFIEGQLRAAGFNVRLYENIFGGATKTPAEILGGLPSTVHANGTRHSSSTRHGGGYQNKLVNYIEEEKDAAFVIGANLTSTFFVAGSSVSTFATVPLARKQEFRQLLLQLKPAHTCAFLFVNYV